VSKNDDSHCTKNDDSHCTGTTEVEVTSHGKEHLKRKASRRPRKTDIEGVQMEMN